jgi:choline dehydrogenase-like flavoprotein
VVKVIVSGGVVVKDGADCISPSNLFPLSLLIPYKIISHDMKSFKVIVVGAGPVGLVLAHALQASGIDYVLVERRSQVQPDPAYGLFLWPQIMRIFHQLGLLESILAVSQPMLEAIHRSIDGKVMHREEGFRRLEVM